MNFYTRNRTGNRIIIVLVILNLILLATIWYPRLNPPEKSTQPEEKTQDDDISYRRDDRDKEKRDKHLTGFLQRELDFTRDQVNRFMQLREEHFQKTDQSRRRVDDLRREMMELLLDDKLDAFRVEKLAEDMGQKTAELEKTVFYHFVELMGVCDPEQKSKYKTLLREILNQLKPPGHSPPAGDQPRDRAMAPPPQDRREPPPRDEQGGHSHGERFFHRLRDQLQLTGSQAEKIRPLVESAHQKLEKIPYDSQYRTNEERRQAMNRVNRWLDSQVEALLTEQQKKQYAEIKEERNRRQLPLQPNFK